MSDKNPGMPQPKSENQIRIGNHLVEVPNYLLKLEFLFDVRCLWFALYAPSAELSSEDQARNIWCFDDKSGALLWKIHPAPTIGGKVNNWTGFQRSGTKLIAENQGHSYKVDIKDGSIKPILHNLKSEP